MKISKRLKCIADMIPNNSNVIDVGCDHGLLSIYLYSEKKCNVLATDVNKNALESAKSNIKKYNVPNVKTKLTDGLNDIDVKEYDYIVIAGMGTNTIKNILNNKVLSNNIILSSNNQLYELRKYVTKLGYYIIDEKFVEDHQKKYVIMSFKKGYKKYSKIDLLYGPIVKNNSDYLAFELEKLLNIKSKIKDSNVFVKMRNNRDIRRIKRLINNII